jgi:hypothetical protein
VNESQSPQEVAERLTKISNTIDGKDIEELLEHPGVQRDLNLAREILARPRFFFEEVRRTDEVEPREGHRRGLRQKAAE